MYFDTKSYLKSTRNYTDKLLISTNQARACNWEAQRFSNSTSKWFIESKAATRRKVVTYEPMVDAISCYDRPLEHLT
jgi:hypothetical protein